MVKLELQKLLSIGVWPRLNPYSLPATSVTFETYCMGNAITSGTSYGCVAFTAVTRESNKSDFVLISSMNSESFLSSFPAIDALTLGIILIHAASLLQQ